MQEAMCSVKGVGIGVYCGTAEILSLFLGIGNEAWWRTTITGESTSRTFAWLNSKRSDYMTTLERQLRCQDLYPPAPHSPLPISVSAPKLVGLEEVARCPKLAKTWVRWQWD